MLGGRWPDGITGFDYKNQGPFLDSEYTIKKLNFAIKNFNRAQGWM